MALVRILSFLGELDSQRRAWIENEIATLPARANGTTFIIDLSGVTGVYAALLEHIGRFEPRGDRPGEGTFVVVGRGDRWAALLGITRLDRRFKLFFDVDSALRYVRLRTIAPLRIEQQLLVTRGAGTSASWPA